jgi:hypothetical protein
VVDARKRWSYAYLLGIYLGDGCLTNPGRTWLLRVSLDQAYPGIVDEASAVIARHVPHGRVHRRFRPGSNVVSLDAGWKGWIDCSRNTDQAASTCGPSFSTDGNARSWIATPSASSAA